MGSLIAWLDSSADEQRRMREIVALFGASEGRDELGLGQIRDAVSDALFPGTSTLHTRARYALLVPWCFELAAGARDPKRRLEELERGLIGTLGRSRDADGLMGATVGRALKNLPSTVYWGALERWGILSHAASRTEALELSRPQRVVVHEEGDESISRTVWTTPPAPPGFPDDVDEGFALNFAEARWLQERLLESSPGSLLAHFATQRPTAESGTAWDEPTSATAPARARALLTHAERFSTVMHGAQLLYNLLLAEHCEHHGVGPQELGGTPISDAHRNDFAEWSQRIRELALPPTWRLEELLTAVEAEPGRPPNVATSTRRFVADWLSVIASVMPDQIPDSADARAVVARRERIKGPKARIGNPARLATWGGAAGRDRLRYRWPVVRRILTDIHDGLDRA